VVIFHSYVKLLEGNYSYIARLFQSSVRRKAPKTAKAQHWRLPHVQSDPASRGTRTCRRWHAGLPHMRWTTRFFFVKTAGKYFFKKKTWQCSAGGRLDVQNMCNIYIYIYILYILYTLYILCIYIYILCIYIYCIYIHDTCEIYWGYLGYSMV